MILFRYLQYGFRDTMRSLWRHKGMVLVSVLTVATMLVVLGATVLLAANSEYMAKNMEEELEVVVFLHTDVSREDALALEEKLHSVTGFKEATFVPKEDALENMNTQLDKSQLTNATGGSNPLPDAYHIKLEQMEQMEDAVAYLSNTELFPQIELVRYGQDVVDKMIALTNTLEIVCIAIVAGMVLIALFLVNSTIRLTVATRGEEISIMKYVGATNFYIRVPFFLEGLLIGIVGALLADGVLFFGYDAVYNYIGAQLSFITLLHNDQLLIFIMLVLLAGGTLLGALGSNIATKKYLTV